MLTSSLCKYVQIPGRVLSLTVSTDVRKFRAKSDACAHLQGCSWAKIRGRVLVSQNMEFFTALFNISHDKPVQIITNKYNYVITINFILLPSNISSTVTPQSNCVPIILFALHQNQVDLIITKGSL